MRMIQILIAACSLIVLPTVIAAPDQAKKISRLDILSANIPLVSFENAHPIDVLAQIFSALHKSHPELKGVSYRYIPTLPISSTAAPRITGSFRNFPLADALREMCGLCDWSFRIFDNTIEVTDSDKFFPWTDQEAPRPSDP
jgi:hypothetical protein